MNILGISDRVERGLRIGVGLFFAFAALSDMRGSVVLLAGIVPPEASRSIQVLSGCVVMASALALFMPRLARYGGIVLAATVVARSTWDMTGGQPKPFIWPVVLFALAIIIAWGPEDRVPTARK